MSQIDKAVFDFHKWYDGVQDPTRMLLLLGFVTFVQLFVAIGNPIVSTVAVLLGYVAPLYTRIWYLNTPKPK